MLPMVEVYTDNSIEAIQRTSFYYHLEMKVVILAGGLGTRISEESHLRPKPMIEIGGRPILWHIMKHFSHYGFNEFVICCGYKGYMIKEYFANYFLHMSDVTIDLGKNETTIHRQKAEPWKVTLKDTGDDTATGGRLLRIREYLDNDFFVTYGDGVSDVNLKELLKFHRSRKKLVTVTAVKPKGRFGVLEVENDNVKSFTEKPAGDGSWISAGFFVCNITALSYISGDQTSWEQEPLQTLSSNESLAVWKHEGFWSAMDTLRDKVYLETLWQERNAPWKIW